MVNKKHFISCLLVLCAVLILWPDLTHTATAAATAKDKYFKAEACYKNLRKSAKKQKYRNNWLFCIKKFKSVYRHDPSGPWAAAGLYKAGELYLGLYRRSSKKSDQQEAADIFKRIVKQYPKSRYCLKAEKMLVKLPKTESKPKTKNKKVAHKKAKFSKNKKIAIAPSPPPVEKKTPPGKTAVIKGLRFWSNPSYTRIVVDADSETTYTHRLLKRDALIKKPKRLYVDLKNSVLDKNIQKDVSVNDNLLMDIRAGQNTLDSVRVVVDIKSFKTYKIFSLKNPFRIVIDVWGSAAEIQKRAEKGSKMINGAIAKQLALGVSRIVIDAGHGGRDYGAPGSLKGVHEKNIVLQIAKRLAKKIRKRLNCEVIMTRDRDKFLALEERTAIANTKNADLFISIHTNAARDKRAFGIETYFLNLATDNESILVAARENATSTKNISDLQTILNDLMQHAKINESSRLADHVQKSLCNNMKKHYKSIKNKGVKQAPFYVFLGAQMPAILIETSFISNGRECKRLANTTYQDRLCEGIVDGIAKYIKESTPAAFLRIRPESGVKG